MEDQMLLNQELDKQWPCEMVDIEKDNYPYPYLIEDEVAAWKEKTAEEIEETVEDARNVRFAIKDEYNVKIAKQRRAAEVESGHGKVQVFRVSLA